MKKKYQCRLRKLAEHLIKSSGIIKYYAPQTIVFYDLEEHMSIECLYCKWCFDNLESVFQEFQLRGEVPVHHLANFEIGYNPFNRGTVWSALFFFGLENNPEYFLHLFCVGDGMQNAKFGDIVLTNKSDGVTIGNHIINFITKIKNDE